MLKTLIIIPTYNRGFISKLCIKTIYSTKQSCKLMITDDESFEYSPQSLFNGMYDFLKESSHIGICRLRLSQFRYFLTTNFDFLYLTDSDAAHDPTWFKTCKNLYAKYNKPVCLFNSINHASNTIEEKDDVYIRSSYPGISIFIPRAQVRIICDVADKFGDDYFARKGWDWTVSSILGKFITPKISYVEHLGAGGIHNKTFNEDIAINPTEFLKNFRSAVLQNNNFPDNEPIISLCHATRGRPTKCLEAKKLFLDKAGDKSKIEHIFAVDNNDDEVIKALQFHNHVTVTNPKGCVRAWNLAARVSRGKILVQLSDDWIPPQNWDLEIIKRIGDYNKSAVLEISDGYRTDDLLCMAILTRARYNQQGNEMFSDEYVSMGSDREFTFRARKDGVIIPAKDFVITHDHPFHTGKEMDATYSKSNSGENYALGNEVFNRRNNSSPVVSQKQLSNDYPKIYNKKHRQREVWHTKSLIMDVNTLK